MITVGYFLDEGHSVVTWDLQYETLEDARSDAELMVDDREADEATLSAPDLEIYEVYRDGLW